jgi:diacylglycerol kinase family enzyme
MKTSTLAVVNPAAGFGKCAKLLGPALDRLRAAGARFDVAETKRAGHGIEIARNAFRDGYRKFIAVGGDGTSFEIVNGRSPKRRPAPWTTARSRRWAFSRSAPATRF